MSPQYRRSGLPWAKVANDLDRELSFPPCLLRSAVARVPSDAPQVTLDGLPSWLVEDLRALQPSLAGPSQLRQEVVTAFADAGILTHVDPDEDARAKVRVNEIPVTALGNLEEVAIHRDVELATDYVVAFPSSGFELRRATTMVGDAVSLVAVIAGDRPCLVYAWKNAAVRGAASIEPIVLLGQVAAIELRMHHAEDRQEQALSAAAAAWSALTEASQEALRLQVEMRRLANSARQAEEAARKLTDAMATARRLLVHYQGSYGFLRRALELFRKRPVAADPGNAQSWASRPAASLLEIISVLDPAGAGRTDAEARTEPQ